MSDIVRSGGCAAVVLAAGSSSRLGQAKQFVRLGDESSKWTTAIDRRSGPAGETLLERAVRVAAEAGLRPIYVVVRQRQGLERASLSFSEGFVVWVENRQAEEGMAASIRLGVEAARGAASGVVVMACDQPAVTPEHLALLAGGGDQVVASAYAGRRGVPAYFPASAFASLMALAGDTGARALLAQARSIPLPLGEIDIDTIEDLLLARQLFR